MKIVMALGKVVAYQWFSIIVLLFAFNGYADVSNGARLFWIRMYI